MGDHKGRASLALLTGLLAAGAIALTACGSDTNDTGDSSAPAGGPTAVGNESTDTQQSTDCAKGSLNSDGSTAQQNAMTQWIKDYQTKCTDATITYGGGGSGQGVTDFIAGQVDFAGSDAALSADLGEVAKATKTCGSQAIDLPMVTGPIAIAFHVDGVDDLTFTPDVLAKVMLGKITNWDDPAIKAINPDAKLPSAKITVFNRADESGTTQNFESYLAASAPSVWTETPSKDWAGVGQGKQGNTLVGAAVKDTSNSIAYVEWSYAIQNNLAQAKIDNGAGPVELTAETVAKTVATASPAPSGPGDLTLKLDYATKEAGAYPILLVSYEIVCSKYADSAKAALVKSFLSFTASDAEQNAVHNLGYAALPAAVTEKVQAQIAKIS